jgi:hypothetical protein
VAQGVIGRGGAEVLGCRRWVVRRGDGPWQVAEQHCDKEQTAIKRWVLLNIFLGFLLRLLVFQ